MEISKRIENSISVVAIVGNLTWEESGEVKTFLQEVLKDSEINHVILNCAEVKVIDSKGVGVITLMFKSAKEQEKTFSLCQLSSRNFQIFEMIQLDKIIPIHESEAVALQEIAKS